MNTTEFFGALREQGWVLYVPERIYRAHRDGLLRGWGVSETGRYPSDQIKSLLELLKEQKVDLKIPFKTHQPPDSADETFLEVYRDRLITFEEEANRPPVPEPVISSDVAWDSLVSRLNLTKSLTNRTIAWNNWAYRIRFFKIWVASDKQALRSWPPYDLPSNERPEWYREMKKVRAERRVLREEYGLNGEYFGPHNTRRPILAVLKKAYPPDQVRRVRRQFEEKLRKDPAEVIRFGLERGLLK